MMDYVAAHKFCSNNKEQILKGECCGCFYCLAIFKSSEIIEWIDSNSDTALCPYCGIDAVIGEDFGYPLTEEFLERMQAHWFGSC